MITPDPHAPTAPPPSRPADPRAVRARERALRRAARAARRRPAGPAGPATLRRTLALALAAATVAGLVAGGLGGYLLATRTAPVPPTGPAPARTSTAASLADAGLAALRSPQDIQSLVRATAPAVVAIRTGSATDPGLFPTPDRTGGAGTGFVLDPAGIIVTNNHVVASDPAQLEVVTADGAMYEARILGRVPALDLAVLAVTPDAPLPALTLGTSGTLQPGDDVVAIGNALGLDGELSVTRGIISATGRTVATDASTQLLDMLQTDAAINPGNSGGPLLDAAGRVVGINTAIANPDQAQNIGFAIAADAARPVIAQLRAGRTVELAYLGVHAVPTTPADRAALGSATAAAKLVTLDPDAPAAGQLRPGDLVTALDGTPVRSAAGLGALVRRHRPGDTVPVTLRRAGPELTVRVRLGASPVETLLGR